MIYIDTHTHLYDEQLNPDEDAMIQRAADAGVTKMYMPNCDSSTVNGMLRIAEQWPKNCFPMMGLHPTYVKDNYQQELATVKQWLGKHIFYGVGEIGLDYYWDLTYKTQQIEAFKLQIDWGLEHNLPIIIHSRESIQDCIDIVKKKQNGKLKGIFHCFGSSVIEARQIIELGFYMGIGGVVTFKKSNLPEVIQEIGLSNVVLETDAPYLAPVPYRGKRNESAYIPLIAQHIATTMDTPIEEVAAITTRNAEMVFNN